MEWWRWPCGSITPHWDLRKQFAAEIWSGSGCPQYDGGNCDDDDACKDGNNDGDNGDGVRYGDDVVYLMVMTMVMMFEKKGKS